MDRLAARKQVVADLDALGLRTRSGSQAYGASGRSLYAIIEPLLTDQWFVKIGPLAEPAIAAVENGDIQFVPKQYENTYFAWMRDQRLVHQPSAVVGHRVPAFYDTKAMSTWPKMKPSTTKYGLAEDIPLSEDDVLETWFSALWPLPPWVGRKAPELERFLPTNTLITNHDIISFGLPMIMMTYALPTKFRSTRLHPRPDQDAEGQKMSKTGQRS